MASLIFQFCIPYFVSFEALPSLIFSNPFKILQSESERNLILITILRFDHFPEKIELLAWWHLFQLVERIIFKQNIVQNEPSLQIL